MSSYDDMLGRLERETLKKEQLVSSLTGAANTNPDDFARQIELAKAAKVSIDALPDYTEQAKQIKVLGDAGVNRLWKDNPVVANWLTDENNAKVAFDQTQQMGLLENATRKLGFFASGVTSDLMGGGIEGTGNILDAAWRRAVSGVGKLVLPTPEGGGTIDESSLAPAGMGEGFKAVGKGIQNLSKEYIEPTGPRSTADQVAAGLGQGAGQVALMMLPGGQPAALALMFGQGAKQQQDKIDFDKMSLQAPQSDKDWEVLTGGAITGITEFLASKLMIKTPQAFALRSKMLDFSAKVALGAGEEAIQEFSENTLQDLAHIAMTNPESTIKWNEAVEGGEIGAWVGGIMQAVINGALHIKTRGQQASFKNLNDVAAAQQLRDRSRDSYQSFADATAAHLAETTDGAVTDVYIDANTLKQTLLDNKVDPASVASAVPSIGAQFDAALETNGDVVIPMNEWVGRIAGTDIGNMLYQHARSTPESLSMSESETARGMAPEIKAQLEQFAASQVGQEEFKKGAKEVEGTLFKEIKATGRYSDAASRVYANLVRDFYVVQAAKLGINPLELYNEKPYKVTNEGSLQPDAELSQVDTSAANFQSWFGKSVMTNESGSPLILYHGTGDNVTEFDLDHPNRKDTGWLGTGVYLTDSTEMASAYAGIKGGRKGGNVMPLYARLENPYMATLEDKQRMANAGREGADQFTARLKEQGHDGVILDYGNGEREIVVFDPAGVKSIFNEGTFDPNNPDILQQRGEQQVGKTVPETVDAVSNVTAAFEHAAGQTFKTNRDFKLDIQNRVLEAAKAAGVDLSDFTKSVEQYLVRVAMADSVTALDTNPNAVGWYNEKVTKALRLVSLIHPEINTDPQAKFAFTWALAVTSNGLKVDKNFELAERAYRAYKETGKMPTDIGAGTAQIAINSGLDLYNELIEKHGFETVEKFMTTKQTVKEVEAFTGRNVSGENLTTEVYGAAALGPKIGNGFFANLYGHFEQLTMDRWLMRTWGRWTATLVEENKANVKTKRGQLKSLIQAMSAKDRKAFEKIIKAKLLIGKNDSLDAVAKAINKASTSPANRVAMAKIAAANEELQAKFAEILGPLKKNQKRISLGDEIRKVGNSLTGYLDGQKEAPSGPPERARIRKVMGQVLEQMQAKYPALTMSDLQALLWYPEKRLYDAAKTAEEGETSYEDDEAPDYANAAAALAKELGVEQSLIEQTITEVDNELQAAERARRAERGAGNGLSAEGTGQEARTEAEQNLVDAVSENGGITLNPDGTVFNSDTGYIATLRSITVDSVEAVPQSIKAFAEENAGLLGLDGVVIGAFAFNDGTGRVSVDLNIVTQDQDLAVRIGQEMNQISVWDIANAAEIKTGGTSGAGLSLGEAENFIRNLGEQHGIRYQGREGREGTGGVTDTGLAQGGLAGLRSDAAGSAGNRVAGQAVGGRSYGTAIANAVSRVGYHFSREPRTALDSSAHGTGLTGQERVRLEQANDDRIKQRIYFYTDTGNGIKPEAGVGINAHSVNLNNLYDIKADPLGLRAAAAANGIDPAGVWFNAVESAIIDAGFDGYVSDAGQGTQGVAVLLGQHSVEVDQAQAPGFNQPAPRTQARGTPVFAKFNQNDIFYSALQRAFENVKQGTMPADQWLKWLSSNQSKLGVKKEEIEATGLREYLELNGKEKLTKEQVTAFIRDNGIQIKEVVKGGGQQIDYSEVEELPVPSALRVTENDDDRLQQYKYAVKTVMDGRYVGYGNTEQDALSDAYSGYPEYWNDMNPAGGTKYDQYVLPGGQNYRELLLTLPPVEGGDVLKYNVVKVEDGWEVRDQTGNAVSIHSTEDRALARVRDLDQKSVAQDRRVEGYRSAHWDEPNILAHIRFNERTDANNKRVLFIEEIQSDWAQAGRKQGFKGNLEAGYSAIDALNAVPNAPFVKDTKSWVALSIKRMIRYAAENGYDKVAFVTGKQSADRYNLAKQIDYIEYEKTGDNDYFIKAIDHNGRAAATEYKQTPDQLEALVGKEIAQKIVDGVGKGTLRANDLEVGGEGMKSFYDKIVPQVANDVLKKLGGGKVETINFAEPTQKQKGWTYAENEDGLVDIFNPQGEFVDTVFNSTDAQRAIEHFARGDNVAGGKYEEGATQQLGFTITPEMRDAVMAGQALFQPTRGGFDPARLTTILTEKADYSTFLHETGHFFLTMYSDMASAENATPQMKADMQTILDWFGISDLATWNAMSLEEQRKYHEQFAYNYEIYLFEGKAPSAKMQSMFDKFTAWLKRVYKSIRDDLNAIYRQEHDEDLPILTGEVRDVMDRMLASDEQIKQAQQIRGMAPSFQTQEQAGVDDATWAAYQQFAQEATDAAMSDLTNASLRQMKWLENARSRIIKDIQRSARETRRAMQAEVAAEVNAMPEFAAQTALREAKDETEKAAVLDTYGFKSKEELNAKLKETGKKAELIRKITDQRMLEEHSDMYDQRSIQVAVERALHNEARARFIAVELRMLSKAQTPVRVMQEAAKQAARSILMDRPIADLKEKAFVASEARAARQVMESLKRDDMPAAVNASRAQLLNNQLAAQTLAIKSDFAKSMELFKKLFRKDDKLASTRDMNYISVARAMLATYGLGKSEQPPSFYLEKIKAYDPEFYAEIEPMITAHLQQAKPITQLTVAEFQDLADQIKALWHLSGRLKKNEVDGKLVDRKEIVAELNTAISPMLTGKERIGYDKAVTKWQESKIGLMGIRSALRRVESWVDAMDQGKQDGPFRKFIWNPISEAVTNFRTAKVDFIKRYLDIMQAEEGRLDTGSINAPEIGYTFQNKAELLHAILHTGNESNKRKLLLGRNWGALKEDNSIDSSRFDQMIARMHNDGTLTKQDYDFAQKVWDLLEEMKAGAQKAHYQMYGFYFNEITANPLSTPFGTYRGGYVPAVSDPRLNTDQAVNNEKETEQTNNSYMFPTTGRGFTKGRVEYNKPLLLDLGFLPSHIDKVLRFTHIEPRVKEVAKIIKNREFGEMIDQLDPTLRKDMLIPWLQRTAMQAIQTPSSGEAGRRLDKVFSELRTRTGMQAMVGNFVNAIQQFTGFSIAALKVKPKYLKMATVMYIKDPKGTANAVSEMSPYMRTRMDSSMFEMAKTIDQLLINPTKYDKLRQFAEKHGYFLQQGTQNIVDTIVWTGAYNEAIESGLEQKEAVRSADAAVRQTQGSFSPEDVSRAESGTAFVRMFLMFYSYFNMQANLLGTEFSKVAKTLGVKRGAGKMFYIYAMGFMIPAVMSEMMVQAAGGFDDGDDDDYDWTDALKAIVGSQFRSAAAMVPGIGSAVNAMVNMANKKPYDDRISTSPVVTNLESAVRAPVSVYQAIAEDKSWKRAVRDVLTMLGLITRLPLGQIAKPAGYAADVAQGKVTPESPMDVARGVISGKDVNRKD